MYKDIVLLDGISADYLQAVRNFIAEWESYSPVIRVTSSGTTGAAKTFEFTKEQVKASALATGRFFHFKKGEAVLLNLSPDFVAGKLMIVRALLHEMKLVVAPLKQNPLEGMAELPFPVKLAAFVPAQVHEILGEPGSENSYRTIENVIIGGGEVTPVLEAKLAGLENNSYATFGMTETLTHFALRRVDGKTAAYTCLPGVNIQTDDRSCLVVEPNEVVKERLVTNDIVELTGQNTFRWKGRIDNVINSGGIKISPEEDEKKIAHLLGGSRFYIASKKDEKLGEMAVLVVEGPGWTDEKKQSVLAGIFNVLPKYHAPKSIIFEAAFEITATGKIKRRRF